MSRKLAARWRFSPCDKSRRLSFSRSARLKFSAVKSVKVDGATADNKPCPHPMRKETSKDDSIKRNLFHLHYTLWDGGREGEYLENEDAA